MFSDFEINIDYIINSKLFEGLTAAQIESFLNLTNYDIRRFKAGEDVPTDIDKSVFVLDGSVATYDNRPNGTKAFISTFEPSTGCLIAISVIRPYPYENFVMGARKNSVVLYLETMSIMKPIPEMLSIQNTVQQNVIKIFYQMTGNVAERTFINTESYASTRIKEYLKLLYTRQKSETIVIPLKRAELADHLNMDISTINREFNKLSEKRLINVKGKSVIILDADKFKNYIFDNR